VGSNPTPSASTLQSKDSPTDRKGEDPEERRGSANKAVECVNDVKCLPVLSQAPILQTSGLHKISTGLNIEVDQLFGPRPQSRSWKLHRFIESLTKSTSGLFICPNRPSAPQADSQAIPDAYMNSAMDYDPFLSAPGYMTGTWKLCATFPFVSRSDRRHNSHLREIRRSTGAAVTDGTHDVSPPLRIGTSTSGYRRPPLRWGRGSYPITRRVWDARLRSEGSETQSARCNHRRRWLPLRERRGGAVSPRFACRHEQSRRRLRPDHAP
jgi:hypothetical protein